MYKLCKTEQSAMRQHRLEQGLLRAMQIKRYEDITISQLCDDLSIPRKSFYRYFSGKDGALVALLDHTLMEFDQSNLHQKGRGTATGELERFFAFWQEHRELLTALERSHLHGMLVERATFHAINERMMPMHLKSMSIEIQSLALNFTVSGLLAMVFQWHNNGCTQTPKEMAKVATMILGATLVPNEK